MSRSLNNWHGIGHCGQDPEIRTTNSGTMVAKVSLATNDYGGKDPAGNVREKTNWHRLTFFGKLAEVVERYVEKGDRLYVEGHIDYSTTESEGHTRYWTDIIVDELVMLGSLTQDRAGSVDAEDAGVPDPADDPDGDRLPF